MKQGLFFISFLLSFTFISAQEIYVVEGKDNLNGINFKGITKIGGKEVLSNKKETYIPDFVINESDAYNNPFSILMASLAIEKASNTIVFMPMVGNTVYYYNMKTKGLSSLSGEGIFSVSPCDEGTYFNRMTQASDGKIYALNNNSNVLLQIDIRANQIKNLGQLNIDKSIDKSWGGDLLADTQGNIYLFSAKGNIFKINIATKATEELGQISGLPEGYTTNGTAVLASGEILLGNSLGKDLYVINSIKDLKAKLYKSYSTPVYDLASELLINQKAKGGTPPIKLPSYITLYPTQNINKTLYIKSSGSKAEKVDLILYDLMSQPIYKKSFKLTPQQEIVANISTLSQGVYLAKVVSENGTELLTEKITISK